MEANLTTSDPVEQQEEIKPHHIESAFHHMVEAEKVKANPALLAKVKSHAKKHSQALSAIQNVAEDAPKQATSTKELRDKFNAMALKKRKV